MALGIIHDREGESMEVEPLPPNTRWGAPDHYALLPFGAREALRQVRRGETLDRIQARPVSEGRPLSAMQGVRAALAAGKRRIHGGLPSPLAAGEPGQDTSAGPPLP
jgi:hypothetical protein